MQILVTLIFVALLAGGFYVVDERIQTLGGEQQDVKLDIKDAEIVVQNIGRVSDYNAIGERPLFVEERRFEAPKKVERKKVTTPIVVPLRVQALGIAVAGDHFLAVVKDLNTGETARMKINEEIQGWTLKAVSSTSFTFAKGRSERVITFKK